MEGGFNRSEFNRLLYERLLDIFIDSLTEEQADDAYAAVNFMYTPWPYLEDEGLNRDAFVDVSDQVTLTTAEYTPDHVVKCTIT